jgi:hypothetical protein
MVHVPMAVVKVLGGRAAQLGNPGTCDNFRGDMAAAIDCHKRASAIDERMEGQWDGTCFKVLDVLEGGALLKGLGATRRPRSTPGQLHPIHRLLPLFALWFDGKAVGSK